MRLFIFGLGYTALAVARLAMKQGGAVSGTTRSAERVTWLRGQGIDAFLHPREGGAPEYVLSSYTHILSSVPPQENGDMVLPLLDSRLRGNDDDGMWLGYLSTTGVYGDWHGAWVDEDSELRPNNERLYRRVAAEQAWLARGGHVFRLAGIYGSGRSAIDDVREGTARRIDKSGQVFSRIHVEDIAQTVLASMSAPAPGNVYNVCDDAPAPAHEVVAHACELLGVPCPPLIPWEQAELSAMGREFYSANRRVKNDKIKRALGVVLRYPDYRAGLAQCLQRHSTE